MKKYYVPPRVVIHRIIVEMSIAASVLSAKVNSWSEDKVIGTDPVNEGGDLYLAW